jgi:surface polysaccharide O-acyltransferase-like enzyme
MFNNFVLSKELTKETIPVSEQKNDAKYDLIKFFLSLLVLAIHSTLYPMVLYPWLRIAVPLFFIMSSYFVFVKIREASVEQHKIIIKKFVIRNLQLYFCWCIILLPITLYIRKDVWFAGSFFENILTILKSIFFGSTFVASWFIMATIIGVLIIYLLSKLLRKDYLVFLISLFAFCVVTLVSSYKDIIADTFVFTAINKYIDIFGGLVCSFPAALFWVFIGKLFAEQKIKMKSRSLLISLIICSCIALFVEWKFVISLDGSYNNDSYFMLAPLCILLFLGVEKIKPIYWKNSVYFKRASTIIYVVHGSLLPVVSKLISVVFNARISFLSFILTFICCITIYIFVEIAIKKCRKHRINKALKMLY